MDYSKILRELENASLFDVYRLKCAMNIFLEHPEKLSKIKRQLRVGMVLSYFSGRENKLNHAVLEEINRTNVCVRDKKNGKRWSVPFYALNLSNLNEEFNVSINREELTRSDFHVGEHISFLGKNEQETYGIITQLNPKTASITTGDNSRWRVSYSHLFKIVNAQGQKSSPREMIDVTG